MKFRYMILILPNYIKVTFKLLDHSSYWSILRVRLIYHHWCPFKHHDRCICSINSTNCSINLTFHAAFLTNHIGLHDMFTNCALSWLFLKQKRGFRHVFQHIKLKLTMDLRCHYKKFAERGVGRLHQLSEVLERHRLRKFLSLVELSMLHVENLLSTIYRRKVGNDLLLINGKLTCNGNFLLLACLYTHISSISIYIYICTLCLYIILSLSKLKTVLVLFSYFKNAINQIEFIIDQINLE